MASQYRLNPQDLASGSLDRPAWPDAVFAGPIPRRRLRVCFLFNAQSHQILHAISIAAELARDPRLEVHVAAPTRPHLDYARSLVKGASGGPVVFDHLGAGWLDRLAGLTGRSAPPKLATLLLSRRYLAGFDAIVAPERTSLWLKDLGLGRIPFIHITHGAGDRAVGFERRIARFDFVLLAGAKQRRRMLEQQVIREGGYAIVGYPKFDAVKAAPPPPALRFPPRQPVVLYNPHCVQRLSSWPKFGLEVLRHFAENPRYALIFAPHIKLFDGEAERLRAERLLARFRACSNIHIDLGSSASIEMAYTRRADLYLGDVSSQVYEYLQTPRPCLFLNAHDAAWQADPNYAHWRYGPVVAGTDNLMGWVEAAIEGHREYLEAQRRGLADTFDVTDERASSRAARAITRFLLEGARATHG